jgi:hypothetical protein
MKYENRESNKTEKAQKGKEMYLTCTCLLIIVGGGLGGCMRFEKSGGTD